MRVNNNPLLLWIVLISIIGIVSQSVLSTRKHPVLKREMSIPTGTHVVPEEVDFGLTERKLVVGEFLIVNNSDKSLKILRTEASCGCSQLRVSTNNIPPYGNSIVELEVNLNGKIGNQEFNAWLITDNTEFPSIRLSMHGTVITELENQVYSVGDLSAGQPFEVSVFLPRKGFPNSRITSVALAENDTFKEVSIHDSTLNTLVLKVSGNAPTELSDIEGVLEIEAENAAWKKMILTLNGRIRTEYIYPDEIFGGVVTELGSQKSFVFSHQSESITPAEFSCECSNPLITCELIKKNSKSLTTNLSIPKGLVTGPIQETVVIKNKNDGSTFSIPLYYFQQ